MLFCFGVFLAGVVACLVLGRSLIWALLLGLALFSLLGLKKGFTPRQLAAMAWHQGRDSLIVVPVFLLIGMVTALWRASGTISFFLYYGLEGLRPASLIDSDYQDNDKVRTARDRYIELGAESGFEVAPITWSRRQKGIDDLYKHLFRSK